MIAPRVIATRANQRPAYEAAPPRVRQSDCERYGSYENARAALSKEGSQRA